VACWHYASQLVGYLWRSRVSRVMTQQPIKIIGYLVLAGLLASCEQSPVEVHFAQPFPVAAPDIAGFLPRDQGQYVATDDTAATLCVESQRLVARRREVLSTSPAILDLLGLPHRAGVGKGRDGQAYQVRALAADSFQLRWTSCDTLLELRRQPHVLLRRYQGWYYVSKPTANSGKWTVERIAINKGQLYWQQFNPDSLRIGALDSSTVHVERAASHLLFTLSPVSGRATRQVSRYAGLWVVAGEYQRSEQ
jgi:hypothetical protein